MEDLEERIKNGEFKNKLPYGTTPRGVYSSETYRLERVEFKKALLEELEVTMHPKADILWELAWEHGHAASLNEVLIHAQEFVKLIK